MSNPQEHAAVRWWIYAVGAVAAVTGMLTPLAFFILLLILATAIFRLARLPPKAELVVLIAAVSVLVLSLAMFGASALAVLDLESTRTVRSTPLDREREHG